MSCSDSFSLFVAGPKINAHQIRNSHTHTKVLFSFFLSFFPSRVFLRSFCCYCCFVVVVASRNVVRARSIVADFCYAVVIKASLRACRRNIIVLIKCRVLLFPCRLIIEDKRHLNTDLIKLKHVITQIAVNLFPLSNGILFFLSLSPVFRIKYDSEKCRHRRNISKQYNQFEKKRRSK